LQTRKRVKVGSGADMHEGGVNDNVKSPRPSLIFWEHGRCNARLGVQIGTKLG